MVGPAGVLDGVQYQKKFPKYVWKLFYPVKI